MSSGLHRYSMAPALMHSSRRFGESWAVMMTIGKLAPAIISDRWTSVPDNPGI